MFEFSAVFHWGCENGVAIINITDEDVFIALAGGDRELASEIGGNFMFGWFGDGREDEVRARVGIVRDGTVVYVGGDISGGTNVLALLM